MSDEVLHRSQNRVFSLLRSSYESFSESERKVADYLFDRPIKSQLFSITDLALDAGVSEATVVRFSRKLGFGGFAAFKRALLSEILADNISNHVTPYEQLSRTDKLHDVRNKLFLLMHTALDDTDKNLVPEAFEEAVHAIAHAQRVDLYANNQSGLIALTAVSMFLLMGSDLTARTDRTTQEAYAQHLGPQDVAIVLSNSGKADNLQKIIQQVKKQGVTTIAITGNARSPIAQAAHIHLLAAVPQASLGDEAGVIRIAQIALLDCLAVAVGHLKSQPL